MVLDERKKKILRAVIDSYIETAEPISSRTISKNQTFGLSAATIRNEMADLEDFGFLKQPHTSAGRVPSNIGYRLYVNELMSEYCMTAVEVSALKALVEMCCEKSEKAMDEIISIYSRVVKYPILVVSPCRDEDRNLSYIQLMLIDSENILLAVVFKNHEVETILLSAEQPVSYEELSEISLLINNYISSMRRDDGIKYEIGRKMKLHDRTLNDMLSFIISAADGSSRNNVFVGGISSILKFPEYNDFAKFSSFLEFFENKKNISKLAGHMSECGSTKVIIGSENDAEQMKDCSVVLSKYRESKNLSGVIGVVGPTRMDYSRAISMLQFFINLLDLEDDKYDE